jgi:XTP/dITP diphosphohydrolase
LALLLADPSLDLVTPSDVGISLEVEETGDTYEENAALKARAFAAASGLLTLADDSGLEVDALGGAPGVRSARYSSTGSDSDNVDLLLKNLTDTPDEARTARFVCVVAVTGPPGQMDYARGECEGTITRERRGSSGFGYDPVFQLAGRNVTMAQLPMKEKNLISHRARAVRKAIPLVKRRMEEQGL